MTPEQCRQARELLGWSPQGLAFRANTSRTVVVGFETGIRRTRARSQLAVRLTLEAAGVEFMSESGDGAAIRLRPR